MAFDQALALRPNWKTAQANRALARLLGGKQRAEDALKEAIERIHITPSCCIFSGECLNARARSNLPRKLIPDKL